MADYSLLMCASLSYDPAPPTIEFVRRSGGMFRDMMIHDLDIACWLLDEEPAELFATASVMVDPAIGEAGDVDTAVVTLRMKSGALCQIANSRRAAALMLPVCSTAWNTSSWRRFMGMSEIHKEWLIIPC